MLPRKTELEPQSTWIESNQDGINMDLDRVPTVDVDNYHGLHLSTVLVYLSLNLISFSQILNLVGSGAFSKDIGAVIGGTNETIWLTSAIAIITCVLGPPVSQAADYWGRKWFIVVLTVFGAIGAVVVSRATSMNMAIAGEVIAGLAYGSQPLLYGVASEILPRKWRAIAQGGMNVAIGLAGTFSLLVGFALTQHDPAGFRTFFYITAGVQAVAAVIFVFLYNPPPRALQLSLTLPEKLQRLDWVGYILLAVGIVSLSIGLSWSQNPYSWTNAHVLAPFVVGCVFLIALAVHQWKIRTDGMFHHELFRKDRNFAIALFSLFVEGMVFFSANNFFVFELIVLYDTDLLRVGEKFMITFITAIFSSILAALYCSRTKKLRLPTCVAYVSFLIFNVLMATAKVSSATAMWGFPVFLGTGLGICLTCLVTAAQLSAPPRLISISSGLLLSTRSLGGSVALAIYNAIFNSKITVALPRDIAAKVVPLGIAPSNLPAFIQALSSQNNAMLASIPGVTPAVIGAGVEGLKDAYLESFRYVWVTAAVFSAVAAIGALFLINPTEDFNNHVDAPLETEPMQLATEK